MVEAFSPPPRAVVSAALAALLLAPRAFGAPDAGVPLALARERAALASDVRYELSFEVPPSTSSPLLGREAVRFRLSAVPAELALDFVPPKGSTPSFRVENEHVLVPASRLRIGENELAFDFVAGDGPLNRHPDYLYTLLVPARARELFPCFDQPDIKARYSLTLVIPSSWTAVANGAELSRAPRGDGTEMRFAQTEPLATYQFAFAAGLWTAASYEKDGRRYRLFHRETDAAKAAAGTAAAFALADRARLWMEDYTGLPLAYAKTDFVVVPDFQYGGMEHPGAIFLNARRVFLPPDAPESDRLNRALLISHEVSHLWFGDLVTMRWFDDVWLKEVYANFFADLIAGADFPGVDRDLRFILAHMPNAYEADRVDAGTRPIRQPLDNLAGAGALYGPIIYDKAPVVMRQLAARLGDAGLRAGLRDYLNAHRWGNATWDDLVAALAPHDSGDLRGWARVWVDEKGMPRVRVAAERGPGGRLTRLSLLQSDPAGRGRVWGQRLEVLIGTRRGTRAFPVSLDGPSVDVPGAIGLKPLWILPDRRGLGYARFALDPETAAFLLARGPGVVREPAARALAWIALWDEVRDGELPPRRFLEALERALPSEREELLAARLLKWARLVMDRWLTPERAAAEAPALEALLRRGVEGSSAASLKKEYLKTFARVARTAPAADWLERVWRGGVKVRGLRLDEDDELDLALELAVRRGAAGEALLDDEAARLKNPDRRARLAFLRDAASADPARRRAFLETLRTPEGRSRQAWVEDALGLLNHPLREREALELLPEELELLPEARRTGDVFFPNAWLTAVLSGHGGAESAAAARRFLARADAGEATLDALLRGLCERHFDALDAAAKARSADAR
jgi:aminopeptidase N